MLFLRSYTRWSLCFVCAWLLFATAPAFEQYALAQDENGKDDAVQKEAQEKEKPEEPKKEPKKDEPAKEEEALVEVEPSEKPSIGPREIRFILWDGSVVRGNVGYSAIHVQTKFGRLEVPVENIVTLRPGMESLPDIQKQIQENVEKLGDKEFKIREKAKLELIGMGIQILEVVKTANDGGSAERKKNLQAVLEAIVEMNSDASEVNPSDTGPLIGEDSITTPTFTIVGRIEEKEFELTTQYGILRVQLADIKSADRSWSISADAIEKKLDVSATAFFQRTPATTKIRVNPGDKITIKAEGRTNWASWGDVTSGPDGIGTHGSWNGFNCGKLVARIGKSGEYVGVGVKNTFVAKTGGELFLGIAMQDNFANQNGYQWNGEYKVTVRVESAGK
jgi:hypothetical protein